MLLLTLLTLVSALEAFVRSEGMADDFAEEVMGMEGDVGRCCCSAEEAEPKYLCADMKNNRLYYPALAKEPPRKNANLFNKVTFTSQIFATSHCEKDKAVARASFTSATGAVPGFPNAPVAQQSQDPAAPQAGTDQQAGTLPIPGWMAPAGEGPNVMGEALDIPTELLDVGPVHSAWRAPLANQNFQKYDFGEAASLAKRYRKYVSWPNMKSEILKEKHIVHNGVIYGPTDEHKEKNSVHGQPYCSLYEVVAEVTVKKGATYSAETNAWTYKTTCEERAICRDYKIGHACGFDHEDTVLLKRAGRKGECLQVSSSWGGGTHCPTGQFHDSVNTMASSTWKFCDCRSDTSPSGSCGLSESKPREPKSPDPRVSAPIPGTARTDQHSGTPSRAASDGQNPAWAQDPAGGHNA